MLASRGRASSRRKRLTPLDSRSTMSLRRLSACSGRGLAAIARSRAGSIASNAFCARRRAQRRAPGPSASRRPGAARPARSPKPIAAISPRRMSGSFDSRSPRSVTSPSNAPPTASTCGAQPVEQARAVAQPVEPRDLVERSASPAGRRCSCAVVDHLHAMLGGAQRAIAVADRARDRRRRAARAGQRGQRIERRRRAQRRLAPAVDHLLDLGEEFGLANAAAAALEVEAGAEPLALARNGRGFAAQIARISSITPKSSARRQMNGWISARNRSPKRDVAGAGAGANEGRPLPRQSLAFIIGDGGIDRQHDRSHFGRRTKPQIDPRDIAVLGALLEQLDQPPADAHRGFARIVARRAAAGSPGRTAEAGRHRTNN